MEVKDNTKNDNKNFELIKTKDKEESSWMKTSKRFEEVIFGFIFILLKEEDNENLVVFHIFAILELIQMLSFPFNNYVLYINYKSLL